MNKLLFSMVSLGVLVFFVSGCLSMVAASPQALAKPSIVKRFAEPPKHDPKNHHTSMLHNHLSKKVFDRACAASKDTIDEIIACVTSNEHILKTITPALAASCYTEAYGTVFDEKDMKTHKDMICNNREKFDGLVACIYRKSTENQGAAEVEKLVESMVDVGMCIINALD